MTPADLGRALGPLRRRVQGMIARAVVSRVDDTSKLQELQIQVLADEAHDAAERFQDYGFTSVPHAGAEAVVAFAGGVRSHGLVVAVADRRYRLTGLAEGEVAIHDDQGQVVKLGRDGIEITSPGKRVTVTAGQAIVSADRVELGGIGGQGVARIGDKVEGGVIVAGSTQVFAA